MVMNISEFKTLYMKTAREYLDSMEHAVTKLRKNYSDKEAIETMYISSHSLKSQSIAIGYSQIGSLSNLIENIFYEVKENTIKLSADILSTTLEAILKLQQTLDTLGKENRFINLEENLRKLDTIIQYRK